MAKFISFKYLPDFLKDYHIQLCENPAWTHQMAIMITWEMQSVITLMLFCITV